MIWFAAGMLAALRLRLFTAHRVAFAVPAMLLGLYAWSRTTLSMLGMWIACVFTLAILWRDDRG